MATDLIRYDLLVQDALRSVVRKVLADTARAGLIGDHHFKIAFKTQAPGVVVPSAVKSRFPDEMSIILQHEFWDLVVTQDAFEVNLNFSRKPERLIVPFEFDHRLHRSVGAVRLQARAARAGAGGGPRAGHGGNTGIAPAPAPAKTASAKPPSGPAPAKSGQRAEKPAEPAGEAKVVSIDAFRKK